MRLSLESVAASREGRSLFESISLTLQAGQALLVRGENGAGKSTLLRVLAGLTRPSQGQVRWTLAGPDHAPVFLGHGDACKGDLNARENLRMSLGLAGVRVSRARLDAALDEVGLSAAVARPARRLSQGQRRRLGLARLGLLPERPWILDEPLAALDPAAVHWLERRLDRQLAAGGLVIASTHQPLRLSAPVLDLELVA